MQVPAGVMGSEGSAACGGCSDPSEWQRSTKSRISVSPMILSGTATGIGRRSGLKIYWFRFALSVKENHPKCRLHNDISSTLAGVMELVDVVDSKSTAGDSVPVRVRSPAPYNNRNCDTQLRLLFFCFLPKNKGKPNIFTEQCSVRINLRTGHFAFLWVFFLYLLLNLWGFIKFVGAFVKLMPFR